MRMVPENKDLREKFLRTYNDEYDYPLMEQGKRRLLQLPLIGKVLGRVLFLTGKYPIDIDYLMPTAQKAEEFLAQQRKTGIKFEAETEKNRQKKDIEDYFEKISNLACRVRKKLIAEKRPEPNSARTDRFTVSYEAKISNGPEYIIIYYFLGGKKDKMVDITHHFYLDDPNTEMNINACMQDTGLFEIEQKQLPLDKREEPKEIITNHKVNRNEIQIYEDTGVVITRLIDATERLFLQKPAKTTSSRNNNDLTGIS